jgi:hypothetical protein
MQKMTCPQLTWVPEGWVESHWGAQQEPLYATSPAAQQRPPVHVAPAEQQLTVPPHPSACPQPAFAKSAHVLGVHDTHALLEQISPVPHLMHAVFTPHPRSTAAHPVTVPASSSSAHVRGVQQPPS